MSHARIQVHRREFNLALDFELPESGILGLYGPSGSGKTSVLRILAGLEWVPGCEVVFKGQVWQSKHEFVSSPNRRIGYVPQQPSLFPHLTVMENLCFSGIKANDHELLHCIEMLGLIGMESRLPSELSGGEQQRVALLRALVSRPQLLLLDEPLTGADTQRQAAALRMVSDWSTNSKIPVIYVSHNWNELLPVCDDLLILDDGKPQFIGPICQAMLDPKSSLSDSDLTASVWEGTVVSVDTSHGLSEWESPSGTRLTIKGIYQVGQTRRVAMAANDVGLSLEKPADHSALNGPLGSVIEVRESGDYDQLVQVQINQDVLICRVSNRSCQGLNLTPGQPVYAQLKTQSVLSWSF